MRGDRTMLKEAIAEILYALLLGCIGAFWGYQIARIVDDLKRLK